MMKYFCKNLDIKYKNIYNEACTDLLKIDIVVYLFALKYK